MCEDGFSEDQGTCVMMIEEEDNGGDTGAEPEPE